MADRREQPRNRALTIRNVLTEQELRIPNLNDRQINVTITHLSEWLDGELGMRYLVTAE